MHIFPYKSITFETDLTTSEVEKRLTEDTDLSKKSWFKPDMSKLFTGNQIDDGFKLKLNTYKWDINPSIEVNIQNKQNNSSKIEVTFYEEGFLIFIYMVFFGILLEMFITNFDKMTTNNNLIYFMLFIILTSSIITYFTLKRFYFVLNKTKIYFDEMLAK